jgi:hypothetical protein
MGAAVLGRGGWVQAPAPGISTLGVDRVVAYEVETYGARPEGLSPEGRKQSVSDFPSSVNNAG